MGQSHTLDTAFDRYHDTIHYFHQWYMRLPWEKDTKFSRVNAMHRKAADRFRTMSREKREALAAEFVERELKAKGEFKINHVDLVMMEETEGDQENSV